MEVVRLVGADGHEAGRHGEAVDVAADGTVHVCQFMHLEVVAGREREVPVWGGTHRAAD